MQNRLRLEHTPNLVYGIPQRCRNGRVSDSDGDRMLKIGPVERCDAVPDNGDTNFVVALRLEDVMRDRIVRAAGRVRLRCRVVVDLHDVTDDRCGAGHRITVEADGDRKPVARLGPDASVETGDAALGGIDAD